MSTTVNDSKRHLEINATEFDGQLDGTIKTNTTAITQSAGDNSTKVATTAYADAVLPSWVPSSNPNYLTGYTVTQSDVTAHQAALSITESQISDLQSYLTAVPTGYATESYVQTQITNLVDSAPSALNTLDELAAALGDDANFATTITTSIGTKLPKGGGIMTGDIILNDNVELEFGTGSDVKMKFDGADLITTVPSGSTYMIGTNGGTPHDNSNKADFVVDVNASPQISLYSDQVQIGSTDMNWSSKFYYSGTTNIASWNADLNIFTQGSGTNTAKNINIKPQGAGGTTTTVATFNGDAGTTLTGTTTINGALTVNYNGDAVNLRSTTNGQSTGITFSSDVPDEQIGHIEYTHSNTASYGGGEAFIIGGTETTVILADGQLMYKDGIYSKPSSGTGAGTRKDANWDTAYTHSQSTHAPTNADATPSWVPSSNPNYLTSVPAQTWASITGKPSTFTPSAHNQAWSTITSTPTTISGYGITDAFDGAYGSLTGTPTIPTDFVSAASGGTFGGNVTVGSNSLTAGSLDINGNADISGTLTVSDPVTITGPAAASTNGVLDIRDDSGNTSLRFGGNSTYSWIQSHSSKPLKINELGNNVTFGSGTVTTGGKVRINATTTTGLEIASSSGATSGLKLFNNSSTDAASIINHYNGDLLIGTNNATVLTMNGTASTFAGDVRLPASGKLYLWTGHDANYLRYDLWTASASAGMTIQNSSTAGEIYLRSGNALTLTLDDSQNATFAGSVTSTTLIPSSHIYLGATKHLYLDGGGNTSIRESSADTIQITAGGSVRQTITTSKTTFVGEIEGDSLDINGAAAINGKVVIEGDSAAWNTSAPGTTTGSLHFDPGVGTDHYGNAITFGASDSGNGATAQAGIYLRTDGSYGSKMYFATTDSYASGSKIAMYINHNKDVYFNDDINVAGNIAVSGTVDGVDISALPTSFFNGAYGSLSGVPSTFTPSSHTHTFGSLTSKPTTLAGYGITDASTTTAMNSAISTAVANLVDSSPAALDTLNELAAAIGDDANFSTTITTSIGTKAADNAVVKLTGNQTIAGNKTFSGQITANNSIYLQDGDGIYITGQTYPNLTLSGDEPTLSSAQGDTCYLSDNVRVNGDLTVNGGDITLNGTGKITGIDTVTAATHAANKSYVDTQVATRAASSHTHAYNTLTGIPSTFAPSSHTHTFSSITSKPTTISGYGITDALVIGTTNTTAKRGDTTTITTGQANAISANTTHAASAHAPSNATANSSDATLLARANHTGTQAYSTLTGIPTKATYDLDHLFTLVGAAADTSTNMGVYTSATVPPNQTIRQNIDALATRKENFIVACSDETSDLTTGTAKVTFRMPYTMQITDVRASLTTATSSGIVTVDINLSGSSIFGNGETGTRLTIDAGERTSTTAATAYNFVSSATLVTFGDDTEVSIDIDTVGTEGTGKGLKVTLIGYQR
jgi:hypothetical protein